MEWLKSNIGWLALPYIFFVSVLYQVGYWSHFNINILNFLGLQDSINIILFPFAVEMIQIIIILSYIGLIIIAPLFIKSYTGVFSKIGIVFIYLIISLVLIFYFLTTDSYNLDQIKSVIIWLVLIGIIYFIYLKASDDRIKEIFGLRKIHLLLISRILILLFIPSYAFNSGDISAFKIKQKTKYQYVETSLLNNNVGFENYNNLIYLGKGGETFFFTTPDFKYNLITSQSNFKNLILKTYTQQVELF